MQMKSTDCDHNIYIGVEWFESFNVRTQNKIVGHVCKRILGTGTHSEVKLKIHADMSSIMNS